MSLSSLLAFLHCCHWLVIIVFASLLLSLAFLSLLLACRHHFCHHVCIIVIAGLSPSLLSLLAFCRVCICITFFIVVASFSLLHLRLHRHCWLFIVLFVLSPLSLACHRHVVVVAGLSSSRLRLHHRHHFCHCIFIVVVITGLSSSRSHCRRHRFHWLVVTIAVQ